MDDNKLFKRIGVAIVLMITGTFLSLVILNAFKEERDKNKSLSIQLQYYRDKALNLELCKQSCEIDFGTIQ
jgi:hypothetical protein